MVPPSVTLREKTCPYMTCVMLRKVFASPSEETKNLAIAIKERNSLNKLPWLTKGTSSICAFVCVYKCTSIRWGIINFVHSPYTIDQTLINGHLSKQGHEWNLGHFSTTPRKWYEDGKILRLFFFQRFDSTRSRDVWCISQFSHVHILAINRPQIRSRNWAPTSSRGKSKEEGMSN